MHIYIYIYGMYIYVDAYVLEQDIHAGDVNVHIHICTRTYTCLRGILLQVHVCIHVCTDVCMRVYVCMYVCLYACMFLCMYVRVCMHICIGT